MRVRIIKPPRGMVDGFAVENLKVGTVYDLPASVASLLLVEGVALAEMRGPGAAPSAPSPTEPSGNRRQD